TIASNSSDADGDRNGLGAGIFRDGGSISLHNTILAENYFTGGEEPDGLECRGDVGSDGFNVVGMKDGCNFFSRAFAGPDQRGSRGNRLHPLGENLLAYNGGPTWTVALPAGSIAINRGNPESFPVVDQRNFSRQSPPDVGAYEVVCGDGFVTGDEVCDDGNRSDTDGCLNTCVPASCGDGFVRDGVEACDDGNRVDTDACRNRCALPTCGNAEVEGGEACDDGNDSSTDACLNTCVAASCGDGFVQTGVEACDGEGCLDDCSGLSAAAGGGVGPGDGSGGGDNGGGGDGGGSGGGEAPSGGGGCSLIIPKSN
ncbi:MAG: DUF4215 domain-containing protein, partial [Deltaproteobacteria bacterium]|nr:DUF4215 domain-containing protein [Deltaproteobacteria bacterium]